MQSRFFDEQHPVEVTLRAEPLALTEELDSWLLSIKGKIGKRILDNITASTDTMDRYIEFAAVQEIPGAFIACSFYQQDINDALTRAGIYMGAGKGMSAGTVVPQDDFTLINYKKLVAGHNLPGEVLRNFLSEPAVNRNSNLRLNEAERAVYVSFLKSKKVSDIDGSFYVIGFSIQTMKDQKGVISHEIFHAYSYLNATYRDVVWKFWKNQVSPEDKLAIRNEVGLAYNVEDENLVIDEFQAYLVQNRAEIDRMKAFVPKYRSALLSEIKSAGIDLVRI